MGYGTLFDELYLLMIGFDRGQREFRITAELWGADINWNQVW